jgi:hypothetical protein
MLKQFQARGSSRLAASFYYCLHYSPTGQRESISRIISSAHRTASAIAATVAGTRFPPSYCASFRAARMRGRNQQHALVALIHSSIILYSPFVRYCYMLASENT